MISPTSGVRTPVDRRLLASWVAGFCAFLNLYAPMSLLPMFAAWFRTTEGHVSLLITASTAAVACTAPLAGWAADAIGSRRLVTASLLGLGISTALATTAHTLQVLIFWRILQGVCVPGIITGTVAMLGQVWAGEGVGTVVAGYITATVVGGFCGRFVAGLAGEFLGWRWAFAVLGAVTVLGGCLAARWFPKMQPRTQRAHRTRSAAGKTGGEPGGGTPSRARSHDRSGVLSSSHRLLHNLLAARVLAPDLIIAYGIGFTILFSLVGTFTYVTFYLAAPPFSLGPAALGALFCVYLVGAVVTPRLGPVIDRTGNRATVMGSSVTCVVGLALALSHSLPVVILGLTVLCSGAFVAQAAVTGFVTSSSGESRGTAMGLYVTCYYGGGSVGACAPALLWLHGGWPACVALLAAVQGIALVVAGLVWDRPAAIVKDKVTPPPKSPSACPGTCRVAHAGRLGSP